MAPALPTLLRRGDVGVLTWPVLEGSGADVVVTTREGGVSEGPYRSLNLGLHVGDEPSAVHENRRRAAGTLGATIDDLVIGAQVHGAGTAVVTRSECGRGVRSEADALPGVDALVTATPGVVLVTLVADCVPVVLVDPRARVLACVHAGWRGTAAKVLEAALGAMGQLGARPADTIAALGPAVAPERYQVGPDVADGLRRALGDDDQVLTPDGPGHWLADLVTANRRLLEQGGVPAGQIFQSPWTTGGDGPFFSDRAARPCGRFALLGVLRG